MREGGRKRSSMEEDVDSLMTATGAHDGGGSGRGC